MFAGFEASAELFAALENRGALSPPTPDFASKQLRLPGLSYRQLTSSIVLLLFLARTDLEGLLCLVIHERVS
jgi:hypothetical protein